MMHGDNIGPATEGAVDELAEDIEDIAEGLTEGLDHLSADAARALFWAKVGAGVVLGGVAVIGAAAVVRAVRSRPASLTSGSPHVKPSPDTEEEEHLGRRA